MFKHDLTLLLLMQSPLRGQEKQELVSAYQLEAEAVLGYLSGGSGQPAVPCAAHDQHGFGRWGAHTSTVCAWSSVRAAGQDICVTR